MRTRWGSCTPEAGTVRLSSALASYPDWVIDYVIVHELAHLRQPDHTPAFWALVDRYPRSERAAATSWPRAATPKATTGRPVSTN